MREWRSEPKIFNYPVCWHCFICATESKSAQHSISITELRATSANLGLCPSAGCGQMFCFLPHPTLPQTSKIPKLSVAPWITCVWNVRTSGKSELCIPCFCPPNSCWQFVAVFCCLPITGETRVWQEHFAMFLSSTSVGRKRKPVLFFFFLHTWIEFSLLDP